MSERDTTTAGLMVLRAGVQSSLQDLGRFGHAAQGMSQGGAMDLSAHCWANRLLDNDMSCPTLEIAVGMVTLCAGTDLSLAITGADMQAQVEGLPVGNWCTFSMQRGQTLELKPARQGMRAYLAVQGGFQTEPMLGSVSTVVRNGMGANLREGELLSAAGHRPASAAHVPGRYVPTYQDPVELRVIESCQVGEFSREAMEQFYQSVYTLTPDADRMGARLEGNPVTSPTAGLVSEGIALGAIQIPPDGQPIVLLNDRQTLGGYPKLGVVARVDLSRLCQARPGTTIRFAPVSLDHARSEWQDFCAYFNL